MLNSWRKKIFGKGDLPDTEEQERLAAEEMNPQLNGTTNTDNSENEQRQAVQEEEMTTENLKRILIVDDEEDMIWSLQKNLNHKALNAEILTASSGEEALEILKNTQINLIISDIKMPGISGIDLLIEVRNKYPETGVIIMTAFPSPEYKNEAILKGGLHFLEKPFDINDMRRVVAHALKENNLFKGTIAGVELSDIIQVNCLSGATTALRVKAGKDQEGVIFFEDGKIVHAISGELLGEEAFYKIFSFGGGLIESTKGVEAPTQTIDTRFEVLLIEGSRRIDEAKHGSELTREDLEDLVIDFDTTEPSENLNANDATGETYSMAAAVNGETMTMTSEGTMKTLQEILNEFTTIPGVNTACLVGRDGFLLDSIAQSGVDTEMIGAIASNGFGASESMGNQLGKGSMSMTMIEYNNGPVMLSPVGDEAFLVIVADRESNLGMIRLKIKKHAGEIQDSAAI